MAWCVSGRIRHVQRQDVGALQQFVTADEARFAGGFHFGRDPARLVVEHGHVEACGAARHGLSDAPEAEDAERRSVDLLAEKWLGIRRPLSGAHVSVRLDHAAARGKDQRPGEVRGGAVHHARRIRHQDRPRRAGGDVDVVVADTDVADDPEARATREQRRIDAIRRRDQRAVAFRRGSREIIGS